MSKQWVLDSKDVSKYLRGFSSCSDRGCIALLVAVGAVVAGTAVVSGSVVLVGNTVYWLELQGNCPFS